jgi:hypothetical protein
VGNPSYGGLSTFFICLVDAHPALGRLVDSLMPADATGLEVAHRPAQPANPLKGEEEECG